MSTDVATIELSADQQRELEDIAQVIESSQMGLAWRLIEIGRGLIAARLIFGDVLESEFVAWAKDRCGIGRTRVYECIQACEQFGSSARLDKIQVSAIIALSRDSTPPEARAEVQRRLEAGEPVTHKDAKRIIADARHQSVAPVGEADQELEEEAVDAGADRVEPERAAVEGEGDGADEEFEYDDTEDSETVAKPEPVRPFAHLPALPADVSDAFDSFKLCILRHKLAGWQEISRDDMVTALKSLIDLANAPSEGQP